MSVSHKNGNLVGMWLKHQHGDLLHYVIWRERNGDELQTFCRMKMDARFVAVAVLGARFCETCLAQKKSKDRYLELKKQNKH